MTEFDILVDANQVSPLSLAYIGDAVYELYIRSYIMHSVNMPVAKLHKAATKFVSAKSQSKIYHMIKDSLTEEENAVFKRGRNAHSYTSAKNADIVQYRIATGLEALIGYLYIKKDTERLEQIISMCIHCAESEE
ncbi:MAG: Mini-ribonuclease 3 [Ruminococcaceae bacterium]|nr:Mini-ribonuclease 3 [Oscillospiraceae bacterium]